MALHQTKKYLSVDLKLSMHKVMRFLTPYLDQSTGIETSTSTNDLNQL